MSLVELFLFIMIIVTLLNGFIFFRKLIKLQKKNNELLTKLLEKQKNGNTGDVMPHTELERLRTQFMKTLYKPKR